MCRVRLVLLLLLPSLLRAQQTPNITSGGLGLNSTELLTNSTGTSDSTRPPEQTGTPSEAPTEFVDDWVPAETYLYTADPSALELARCSRGYSTAGQPGSLPASFSDPLRPALDALANTANFLNMIFQASDLRESMVQEDMEWYHALVRALLEDDVLIQRAILTFDADPASSAPQLVLCASRDMTTKGRIIVLQDLTKSWDSLHPPAPAPDDSWFRSLKFPEFNQPMAGLSKRVLLNDLSTLDTPKWRQGDSYVTNRSGVRWASAPFLDCEDGRFVPGWMLTLSTSFYGLKPDLTPEFRGVIRVDVNIQNIDLDQCATGDGWFADTHECNRTTMECVPVPGQGFRLGQYCCRCKVGFYNPEIPILESGVEADGGPVNQSDRGDGGGGSGVCYPNMPICLPCWPGCRSCEDGAPCWVQEAWLLRAGVLAVQGVFMVLIFVSMLVAYGHRGNKRIRASGLLLLETILFGSLLLYFPVFIMYFKPSTFRCILLRWVRMFGFSIVYGTVTLKMYRVLKVFLSRTAQRVPYMSSLHLLRILGVMLMTVSWFLCAWTVGVLQNRDRNIPVYITTSTSDGQGFNLCYLDRWDYMMAVAELLFLCWGSSLWSAVRPVPSAFHEPRYMGIAIHNELLLSTMFHLFRFTFSSLHPDWMLLLSFTHTHVTITVTLALLFIPKFLYVSNPGRREEIAAEVYEDEVDMRRSGSYLNSSFHSAWSEPGVDPEDFRDELKKLYAQLEVNKTKMMAAKNPHLSKKRSSRCTLGRSIIKRLAEIPESMSRQCSRDEKDGSLHSKSVDQSDSFRKEEKDGSLQSKTGIQSDYFRPSMHYQAPDAVSVCLSYKSSIKTPSATLRKSQSDHHYVQERDPSLHDSMLKANAVQRYSRQSETDSLDIPLGVGKSASALNLTIDTNLLHPDHIKLHKSLSLTSTTARSMENIAKVNRASTMIARSAQNISICDQTRSALKLESFDKAEVCPWEVKPEQSVDKNQKHVTYANSQDIDDAQPKSTEVLICPWDHVPSVEKSPSEEDKEIQMQSVTDSPKLQAPVSASAPASPRPKLLPDKRVFSFRTTANKWLSVKSAIGSMEEGSKASKERNTNKEDTVSQKSQESSSSASSATQKSGSSSRRPSLEKKALHLRSMTTTDAKPCLVKQNAIRLSSADSSDRSPRRLVIVKSAVHPWDNDDMQKDGNYENVFLSRQNSKRSSTSSRDTVSSCRTPSTHRRGSNLFTPIRNVSHADMCPWEVAGTLQDGLKKQQSVKADVCPWESEVSEPSNVRPWGSQEQGTVRRQGSERGTVCPWETQDIPVICHTNVSKDSQKQQSLELTSNICPWETAGNLQPPKKEESEYVNVCPRDVQPEVVYENLNPVENKLKLSVPLGLVVAQPGGSKEMLSTEQQYHDKSTAPNLGRQVIKSTESCPWEFPDPPKDLENICPWEEGNTEATKTDSKSQITVKVDVCPWETGHQDKPEESQKDVNVNVCPWESETPEKPAVTKTVSQGLETVAEVCPWDSGEAESEKQQNPQKSESHIRQDTVPTDVCPWDSEEAGAVKTEVSRAPEKQQLQEKSKENVCPWEVEEPKVLKRQESCKLDGCPCVVEEPKVLKRQESSKVDVCPWDTDEAGAVKTEVSRASGMPQIQENSNENVCPWDTSVPKVLKKQDSSKADVCPWEIEEPKVLKKQESCKVDVCPWETEEPKVLKKQESTKADVCPWDTEEAGAVKKEVSRAPEKQQLRENSKENVCPWDVEEPKVLKKQESTMADVCPWDTEEPEVVKKQESTAADVCPWDTTEPKVLKKQDSSKADVCPWEIEEPKVLKKQESTRADVCPWDTEEPEVVKKQESTAADVCPWDSQDPQTSSESRVDIPNNKVSENQGAYSVEENAAEFSTEQIVESREDSLGPWDIEETRSRSGSYTDNNSDVFTWEPENIPEEDEEDDAECAAEAFVFPSDL